MTLPVRRPEDDRILCLSGADLASVGIEKFLSSRCGAGSSGTAALGHGL